MFNSKVLFEVYKNTEETPIKEDVSCHLMSAAKDCGFMYESQEQYDDYKSFLAKYNKDLAKCYDQGFAAFDAAVKIHEKEYIAEKEAWEQEKAESGND